MKKNRAAKEWFAGWSNEYDTTLGKIARHHRLLELVVKLSKVKDGDRVLDIGCGTGLLSLKFLEAADCRVSAVDTSQAMLDIFRQKIDTLALGERVACSSGDAASLRFARNSFDVIASTVTLHHVKDKAPMIRRIFDILKPGGRFLIGDLDLDTTGKLTDVERLRRIMDYLKEELSLVLQDGGVAALERMYDNGKKHLLNDGEYCISFRQWTELCRKAGFQNITVKRLPEFKKFNVLVARK
jgi:ubiquinone/menaquinone biosynthesis C-methylase UbiE